MTTQKTIEHIDQSFIGMIQKKERYIIVSTFPVKFLHLPFGDVQTNFCRVDLFIGDAHEYMIRIFYDKDTSYCLPWGTPEEKTSAVACLQENNICPSFTDILEARSLSYTPGIAAFFGCDYCQ